jgi:hypothetical protein
MKLTRRQLRRLIKESILNEMPFIKPDMSDFDPEGKLEDLGLSDNEEDRNMADALADTFGYEGSYSSDIGHYYNEPGRIMIQQELDEYLGNGTSPRNFIWMSKDKNRKVFTVEEIKKDLIDFIHYDLLAISALDPMKFSHPIPKELENELLDAIKNSIKNDMIQRSMSLEQIAEEIMGWIFGDMSVPEKFREAEYTKEIKRRYVVALIELAGLGGL